VLEAVADRPVRREPPDVTVVTGATGWLGRALLHSFAEAGGRHHRTGPIRSLVHDAAEAGSVAGLRGVEVVVGDVTRSSTLGPLFDGLRGTVDVIHTAGVIHPRRTDEFEEVNGRGTANVLAAARAAGVRRVVHVSSNSPFGTNPHPADRFRNDEPFDPYYGYGRSKLRAELHVGRAVAAGLDAVIVRPPWFYGPFQPARQTTFFTMVRTGRFPVIGRGEQRRSMVYVDNLVQGIVAAELTPTEPGRAWWIADARPYPLVEIVETVGRALRDEGYEVTPNRLRLPAVVGRLAERADALIQRGGRYVQQVHVLGELDKTIACDIGAATAELGYVPEVDLAEGMRRSVRWCREQGLQL
jgi:nucleoside-diphosphate-sugar epimerase